METETRFPETRFHRHNEASSRSRLALTTSVEDATTERVLGRAALLVGTGTWVK